MNSHTPIFVISLPQSKTRRLHISEQLDSLNLDYEITDATDGANLDLEAIKPSLPSVGREKLHGGRGLTRGEIGCFLSHYRLWQRMLDEDIAQAVILEDDAVIQDDFAAVIDALPTIGWRWDIVRFSASTIDRYMARGKRGMLAGLWNRYRVERKINRALCPIGKGRRLVRYKQPVVDTSAYMLTRHAAEVLLRYCAVIREPVDVMYEKWCETDLHFFSIHLPVASQINHVYPAANPDSILGYDRAKLATTARKDRRWSPWKKAARSLHKNHNRWRFFIWNLKHPPEKTKPD